jgi:DNA-binding protein HU-beta
MDDVKKKARAGVNPKTGAKTKIPAKTVVKFRVAKAAKDAIPRAKKQPALQLTSSMKYRRR